MHYMKVYRDKPPEVLDEEALADLRAYLPDHHWTALLELATCGAPIDQIDLALNFCGVSGRPFHAFCRRYRLEDYKAWLRSPDNGGPVEPDEQGFW